MVVRAGIPGLVGAVLVLFGGDQLLASQRWSEPAEAIAAFRTGMLPTASGLALLLAAVAIARRYRIGYLLGLAVAFVLGLAGLVLIAVGILSPGQGLYGSTAVPVIAAGVVCMIACVGYGRSFRNARSMFAPSWRREDRWIAVGFAMLIVVSGGLFVGLGTLLSGQ